MDCDNSEERKNYNRHYWHERRQKIIDFLGGSCVNCGSTEFLEFDHIDPNDKSFDIKTNVTLSNSEVSEELKKCQLLCNTCHQQKTAKENTGFTHGTTYGWMKAKCSCPDCTDKKYSDYDKKNAKRNKTDKIYKKNRKK